MKKALFLGLVLCLAIVTSSQVSSHCQIPCGIYDDEARFTLLSEHITTIEKSMNKINELSSDPSANSNQITRWVNNKESHADEFTDIIVDYFLVQRIKEVQPQTDGYDAYMKKLSSLHALLRYAMKCKQTTELSNTESMKEILKEFNNFYNSK